MKKYILAIIAILWALLIFYASNKDSKISNRDSMQVIRAVVEKTALVTNKLKITHIDTSSENINRIVIKLNMPVRKLAHFTIYFILGILIYYTFICFGLPKESIILVLIMCFIYSLTDEYHQSFVSGRTATIKDCLIDTSGAICGCIIELIIYNMIKKYQSYQRKNTTKNIV